MDIRYLNLWGDYDLDLWYHDGKPVEVLRKAYTDSFGEDVYLCSPLDSSELLDVPERFLTCGGRLCL